MTFTLLSYCGTLFHTQTHTHTSSHQSTGQLKAFSPSYHPSHTNLLPTISSSLHSIFSFSICPCPHAFLFLQVFPQPPRVFDAGRLLHVNTGLLYTQALSAYVSSRDSTKMGFLLALYYLPQTGICRPLNKRKEEESIYLPLANADCC